MEKAERLKKLFESVFQECGVKLYEIQWIQTPDTTLQVSIEKSDGSMDLETCSEVSEKLSQILDNCDLAEESYTLEVCSPGAEREIKDFHELKNLKGTYIFARFKEPIDGLNEITGTIHEADDSQIVIEYKDKTRNKELTIELQNIAMIRHAVKF